MYNIKRLSRLTQSLVHFVIDRANLFPDLEYQIFQNVINFSISELFL